MNLPNLASKEYVKNGFLYTSKQIRNNPYKGTYKMKFYKFLLGLDFIFLWIDDYLNHRFFEYLTGWNYWLWHNTSHKFCNFVCENFEEFENE